jgi:hypothetical protein
MVMKIPLTTIMVNPLAVAFNCMICVINAEYGHSELSLIYMFSYWKVVFMNKRGYTTETMTMCILLSLVTIMWAGFFSNIL